MAKRKASQIPDVEIEQQAPEQDFNDAEKAQLRRDIASSKRHAQLNARMRGYGWTGAAWIAPDVFELLGNLFIIDAAKAAWKMAKDFNPLRPVLERRSEAKERAVEAESVKKYGDIAAARNAAALRQGTDPLSLSDDRSAARDILVGTAIKRLQEGGHDEVKLQQRVDGFVASSGMTDDQFEAVFSAKPDDILTRIGNIKDVELRAIAAENLIEATSSSDRRRPLAVDTNSAGDERISGDTNSVLGLAVMYRAINFDNLRKGQAEVAPKIDFHGAAGKGLNKSIFDRYSQEALPSAADALAAFDAYGASMKGYDQIPTGVDVGHSLAHDLSLR